MVRDRLRRQAQALRYDTRAQAMRSPMVGFVLAVVTVGVTGLVGLLVFGSVNSAVTLPQGSSLSTTLDALSGGFGDAISLLSIVMISMIAFLVIAVIARFR